MQGARSRDSEQRRHGASDFMVRSNSELYNFIKQTTHLDNTLHSNNCKLTKNAILLE
jgi:hypothetical protein